MKLAQQKKIEILNYIFKSKDGASWNEVSEMLNQLILIAKTESNSIESTLDVVKHSCQNCSAFFTDFLIESKHCHRNHSFRIVDEQNKCPDFKAKEQ